MNYFRTHLPTLTIALVVFLCAVTPAYAFLETALWSLVNGVFGTLMGLAGMLMNAGVNMFVIGFGDNFLGKGVGVAVDLLWQTVRDIFNLTFIFGLVFIGLKMILGNDDSGTRQWLVNLIMAALLVNFSLYITKFIVDVSNVTATQIVINGFESDADGVKISDTFMASMGVTSIFDLPNQVAKGDSAFGYIFGAAILYIIGTFVFGVGGILLIIRFAALALYMVLSPFMFVGWVFPQMQSYTRQYWQGFLGRAFFAPIYILLIYFAAKIIDIYYGANHIYGQPAFAKLFGGNGNDIDSVFETTLPPFILSCIFLVAAVVVANKLGADGASGAVKFGKSITGKIRSTAGAAAGGATFGAAAWAGRNTAGRLANKYAESDLGRRLGGKNLVGEFALKSARGVAGSSFDARNVAGLGKELNIGTGKTGGYAKTFKDQVGAKEAFAKSLGTKELYDENGQVKAEFAEEEGEKVAEALRNSSAVAAVTEKQKALDKEIGDATKPVTDSIAAKQAKFDSSTDDEERTFLQAEIARENQQLATIKAGFDDRQKEIENETKKAKDDARDKAHAELIYQDQINYINRTEKSSRAWGSLASRATGGLLGETGAAGAVLSTLGAGALATTLGSAGLAAGFGFTGHKSDVSNAAVKKLRKEYGADGVKKLQAERKRKKVKTLAEEIAKAGGEPEKAEGSVDTTDNPTS